MEQEQKKEVILDGCKAFAQQQKAFREIHVKNKRSVMFLETKRKAVIAKIIQIRRWVLAGYTPNWRFQEQ